MLFALDKQTIAFQIFTLFSNAVLASVGVIKSGQSLKDFDFEEIVKDSLVA